MADDGLRGLDAVRRGETRVVDGGGHTWPGGHQYLPEWIIGKTSRDIDANEVIWDFFKKHIKK